MAKKTSDVASIPSITDKQQTTAASCECKVCDAPARFCYFGAIVCESCKMFFKRNAKNKLATLVCQFNNQCVIDVKNRHSCGSCRLKKCFTNGMLIEMIRSSHPKKNKKYQKKKTIIDSTSTSAVASINRNQLEQIPILNLLRSDQSTLTTDQWNLLSNVIHCFDEYTGNLFVQHLIQDQNTLPLESHFDCSSVRDFLICMKIKIQIAFEKNRDSFSLTSHDRTSLIRTTVQYTTSLGGIFTTRQHRLLEYPSFYKCAEIIYGPAAVALTRRIIDQLDPDDTFIKLAIAILAFSTMKYAIHKENVLINLTDTQRVLSIQDMYTEITWRYLLYKYNHREAIMRFSNLIRCLFCMTKAIVEAHESEQYKEMINLITEQTEQTLRL